jgi:hypothetical protein
MNATQTLLIKSIHAGALELTKNNAYAVLALHQAMRDFILTVPMPDDELKADYDAVGNWLSLAIRKGTGAPDEVTDAELLAAVDARPVKVMSIIERIELAIKEFRKQTMTQPSKMVLGPLAARRLYAWAMDNVVVNWSHESQSEVLSMSIGAFFDRFPYRGMSVELTTEAIDIRITD